MIKNFTIFIVFLFAFGLNAQQVKLVSQTDSEISMDITVQDFVSKTKSFNNIQYEDFSTIAKVFTMEKGSPELPVFSGSVIIPDSGNISLELEYDAVEEYSGIEVLPSKGSLKRDVNPALVPYSYGDSYNEDEFYPGTLANISDPYIFRDTRGVTVSFYPYQYNPVTKKLRVYKNLRAVITSNTNGIAVNEKRGVQAVTSTFKKMYQSHYLNTADASGLRTSENEGLQYNGEMLIIVPDNYMNTVGSLAAWKNQKGIRTTMVPLSQVGNTPVAIKNYIQAFYTANPGLTYLLLVGDHQNLPCYSYGTTGAMEELWSDTYYAQLEGNDYYPELLVGRFSGTVSNVATMVNRTLEYEKEPMDGDWMTKLAGIGSDEGYGYGDDGEADWEHLRDIANRLMDNGYTYTYEFYDGSHGMNDANGSPVPEMISDAVNDGIGLLNYTGHGAQDIFATGWYSSTHVNELTNNGKYPFVVSVACNNGTFTNGTSLCEAWLNASGSGSPTGAIAAAGSSILMAWAEPMQTQDGITDLLVDNSEMTLGGLFYGGEVSMLEAYNFSPTAIEVMQTWVFFGDPSVDYRNTVTQQLIVNHASEIDMNETQLTVQCDTEGAMVTVTQNGVIIGTGIVSGGEAVINLQLSEGVTLENLTVTATYPNYQPYQGMINSNGLDTGSFNKQVVALYPNPADNAITLSLGKQLNKISVSVTDVTGKIIYIESDINISGSNYTIDTARYATGVYMLTVLNEGRAETYKFIIKR